LLTYVDTSTLIKLIINEDGSDRAEMIWQTADAVASAGLVIVEGRAALAAAAKSRRLTRVQHRNAKAELDQLVGDLHLVRITEQLLLDAGELAEIDTLRGYAAVHLTAALAVGASVFTSADDTLCDAAANRGLHIASPLHT
jgi:predicted nucleic acid-binding protein